MFGFLFIFFSWIGFLTFTSLAIENRRERIVYVIKDKENKKEKEEIIYGIPISEK